MKKRLLTSIVIAAIAATVLAILWPTQPDRGVPVRAGYLPIVASLPLYIAQDQKLFEKASVTLSQISFSNSNDMVNALVAGTVDMLPVVSLIPILHLEVQYPGTVRLFSHSRMRPTAAFDSIIVREESDVRDLSGLAGRKIGVFPGTSATNMLRAFLKKHNVAVDRTTFIALPPPAQLTSLESRAIDALFSYEPTTTVALRQGGYRSLFGSVYADLTNPSPIGSSAISREFERKHSKLAEKAIEVVDKAVLYMRSHPTEARQLLPRFTTIHPDIANASNVVDVTLSNENDVESLQRFIDLLVEVGELPRKLDAKELVAPTR